MTRRIFSLLLFAPASEAPVTDVDRLNKFAELYNKYIASLQGGIIDVKLWARVVREWERL
jgi:hypothetical protein